MNAIAIVGMACVYPDARSPGELWENVLAQRRAFRRVPAERLRLEDYVSADASAPDATYATEAAVIEGYEFDRVGFRVAGSTFRTADLAHWLALDVASRALADAGFSDGNGLPREATGVLLGNTLTGEFSRANTLRLRWPYVRRILDAALRKENWPAAQRGQFLAELESDYKTPFPPVGEETLAGGLSNTIAGRICNQFNLKGGGYTVDGACASSLLATANACSALIAGDLDVALVGGVDLSLDPFELVGFAKTGALASEEMRVFDRRANGFWPGEGCGLVVLMRHDDALAQCRRVYAVIRGWGISSDGSGGMTRPESDGQLAAVRRAYRRAGFGIETVSYCEGHGTGTAVGDTTELEVLSRARRETKKPFLPAAIGSIKANLGHTKAAAGIAGLIKATMAVHTQVLPPTTGCEQPHAQLTGASPALQVLSAAELWPRHCPLRASVSAMGFGGINAHVVLESVVSERREKFSAFEGSLVRSPQDAELFLFTAPSPEALAGQIEQLAAVAARISRAEMADLAAQLERKTGHGKIRAGIVASKPSTLADKLRQLKTWLLEGVTSRLNFSEDIFLGAAAAAPRIGFLFPGQGSPTRLDGGVWQRRFEAVHELYARSRLPADGDPVSTRVMQPAVITASLAGLQVLETFGIAAVAATGHSLGELTALHWAGGFDAETLLRLARVRGEAMADLGSPSGAMFALSAPWQEVLPLLNGEPLTIVGYNSPRQTVVAGEAAAGKPLTRRAAARGWQVSQLPVSHAFHTQFVAAAVPMLAGQLAREEISALERSVFSTVTGALLKGQADLRELLCRQVTSPVRLETALTALLGEAADTKAGTRRQGSQRMDLLIEVGPGAVLSQLVREISDVPVVALEAGGNSLKGLLQAAGAAFALGAPVKTAALFADRFTRPFALDWKPKFFANPCELAPVSEVSERPVAACGRVRKNTAGASMNAISREPGGDSGSRVLPKTAASEAGAAIELIRRLVAGRAELPAAAVRDESRMLSDLHLNSITVGQLVSQAAKQLGLPRLAGLTEFANASIGEIACALEERKRTGGTAQQADRRQWPPGVDTWVKTFSLELVETIACSRNGGRKGGAPGDWQIFAPNHHPLAERLREAFTAAGGRGVAVCLPENPDAESIPRLLAAARAVLMPGAGPHFVVIQHGWGGGGFARTLHLENPGVATCVVNVPPSHPRAVEWIVAEALAVKGFSEVHFTDDGRRWEPRLRLQNSSPLSSSLNPDPTENSKQAVVETQAADDVEIGPEDVLLVTGGGKGIAAECALAFACETGVKLALVGRSDPKADAELARNLARMAAAGVRLDYMVANVSDAASVQMAVAEIERQLGPVTAVLHGAGVNTPQLIGALDETAFRQTLLPKISGARNVLAAVDANKLRLFVTFGSIIARTGMPGEADYATANEWLAALTDEFQAAHPRCRCLTLEWSVWSGVGMGERLGRIESLLQQGITPITVDAGVRIFCDLLHQPPRTPSGAGVPPADSPSVSFGDGTGGETLPLATEVGRAIVAPAHCHDARIIRENSFPSDGARNKSVAVVVTGRFGELPTLKMSEPDLPLRRFLERKRVFYPGVELIVDAELSLQTDPYLADHAVQHQPLLPAVLGLEAMAQTAMALAGATAPPIFEHVEFLRPVAVAEAEKLTVRLAALQREPGVIEVSLRSGETDFQADHFRTICRFASKDCCADWQSAVSPTASRQASGAPEAHQPLRGELPENWSEKPFREEFAAGGAARETVQDTISAGAPMPSSSFHPPSSIASLDPQADLYGRILFHRGRFRRLRSYQLLKARECAAEIKADDDASWFGPYLPPGFVLGDPAARDAALHAIQACIPHRRILPTGIERLTIFRNEPGARFVRAKERSRDAENFLYDMEITDEGGGVIERWEGLRLRAVEMMAAREAWPEALLAPYLERRLEELAGFGAPVKVALERGWGESRPARTDTVIQHALGKPACVWRRPDGKPICFGEESVSAAHTLDYTFAVSRADGVACDLEAVASRTVTGWRGLLGAELYPLAERIARAHRESTDAAATRLWTALECLKKIGQPVAAPLLLEVSTDDGWTQLRAGAITIMTCVAAVRGLQSPLVLSVAFEPVAKAAG